MDTRSEEIQVFAAQQAAAICASFKAAPEDIAGHKERLYDLELATASKAAELCGTNPPESLIWNLAKSLPDYSSDGLYETRASLWGLAAAVILGWIMGGVLATVLNLLGLGGEILRPAAIFALLWAGEYLGGNPRLRGIMLALFGLGGLTRIAGSLASGAIRGFGGLRVALTGVSAGAGILRLAWLWFGAILLFIFFSRRVSGLNIPFFQESLASQISQRLGLCCFVFQEIAKDQGKPSEPEARSYCQRHDCQLATAAISLLPELDAPRAAWLADILARTGYEAAAGQDKYLIWDPEEHADMYESIGLVKKGDRCLMLRRPWKAEGKIKRGLVQRVVEDAK